MKRDLRSRRGPHKKNKSKVQCNNTKINRYQKVIKGGK